MTTGTMPLTYEEIAQYVPEIATDDVTTQATIELWAGRAQVASRGYLCLPLDVQPLAVSYLTAHYYTLYAVNGTNLTSPLTPQPIKTLETLNDKIEYAIAPKQISEFGGTYYGQLLELLLWEYAPLGGEFI